MQRAFNGLGQLTQEWQSHSGAVNTSTTPSVQYAYSEMSGGANHSRLTSMTYPNGKVLTFNYSSGVNDALSRLSSLSDSTGTLESYDYLGLDAVVRRAHPQIGVDLTYIKQTGESNGDAGDKYIGLDRFGRVVDQRWIVASSGTALDRFQYGYDRDSNVLWRDNLVNSAFGELYSYDNLNQLASFQRGTLNSGHTAITGTPSASQSWSPDAVGNFSSVTTNGTTQTRSANAQNEITSISGATTPAYDHNGNMTGDETGRQFIYDAWNRLVTVKNSGGTTIWQSSYDALDRRVQQTESSTTTDFYFSAAGQVLEERVGSSTMAQYVWSAVYVDAMILRDRSTNGGASLNERLWVQQDADFNVTALVSSSGTVVERSVVDPYGTFAIYDASWNVRSSSSYGWLHYFQGKRFDAVIAEFDFASRFYSPTLMRFIENDSIGFLGGDANLTAPEGNNPIARTDSTGELYSLIVIMANTPPEERQNQMLGRGPAQVPPPRTGLAGGFENHGNISGMGGNVAPFRLRPSEEPANSTPLPAGDIELDSTAIPFLSALQNELVRRFLKGEITNEELRRNLSEQEIRRTAEYFEGRAAVVRPEVDGAREFQLARAAALRTGRNPPGNLAEFRLALAAARRARWVLAGRTGGFFTLLYLMFWVQGEGDKTFYPPVEGAKHLKPYDDVHLNGFTEIWQLPDGSYLQVERKSDGRIISKCPIDKLSKKRP